MAKEFQPVEILLCVDLESWRRGSSTIKCLSCTAIHFLSSVLHYQVSLVTSAFLQHVQYTFLIPLCLQKVSATKMNIKNILTKENCISNRLFNWGLMLSLFKRGYWKVYTNPLFVILTLHSFFFILLHKSNKVTNETSYLKFSTF